MGALRINPSTGAVYLNVSPTGGEHYVKRPEPKQEKPPKKKAKK